MYTILPSVTLMLHVYQVCHGVDVGCCVKNMSFFLEPGVKISREYCLDILNKCSLLFNTSQPTIIFQHDKTPARCVRNIVQLPQREILNLLWPPYIIGQAIIFLPGGFYLSSSSSFFFFSSPNLSGRRLDVYHTLEPGVALVRISIAGLKCAARGSLEIQDAKNRHFGTSYNFVGLYLRN